MRGSRLFGNFGSCTVLRTRPANGVNSRAYPDADVSNTCAISASELDFNNGSRSLSQISPKVPR